MWFLFWRAVDQKKPRVEAPRVEWRREPAAYISEIVRVEVQVVMVQQRRPRHASRFKIVEQRSSLTFRQGVATARGEHAELFEQLARRAADHRGRFRVRCMSNSDSGVIG